MRGREHDRADAGVARGGEDVLCSADIGPVDLSPWVVGFRGRGEVDDGVLPVERRPAS